MGIFCLGIILCGQEVVVPTPSADVIHKWDRAVTKFSTEKTDTGGEVVSIKEKRFTTKPLAFVLCDFKKGNLQGTERIYREVKHRFEMAFFDADYACTVDASIADIPLTVKIEYYQKGTLYQNPSEVALNLILFPVKVALFPFVFSKLLIESGMSSQPVFWDYFARLEAPAYKTMVNVEVVLPRNGNPWQYRFRYLDGEFKESYLFPVLKQIKRMIKKK